jgi:hypothetical protein
VHVSTASAFFAEGETKTYEQPLVADAARRSATPTSGSRRRRLMSLSG